MNPHKTAIRWLIVTQVFSLFAILLMPTLLQILDGTLGKILYALLVLISVGLTLTLRYALSSLE